MERAGGAAPPGGQGSNETSDHLPADAEAARQESQLAYIERDLDTVDAALSALDSDDLEGAESLAAELEEPSASNSTRAAEQDEGDSTP